MSSSAPIRIEVRLALGYAALIVYASLYPLSGWHDSGVELLTFINGGWPRYLTAFDVATNLVAYVPFGFLVRGGLRRLPAAAGVVLAVLLGGGLSLALETLQNYLPTRVPSNLDLACNALGTLAGALAGVRWQHLLASGGRLHTLRRELLHPARGSEAGLILIGVWLFTQLSPETLLFGSGNLRQLLALPAAQPFSAERFREVEGLVAAAGLLAAGLATSLQLRRQVRRTAGAVLLAALGIKCFAFTLLTGPANAVAWLTPGNAAGLGGGILLWWGAGVLPPALQRAVAALALLFATVMVNVAPDNPYLANSLQVWNPGHFINFNGLTRLACALWPFLALSWLMLYRPDPIPGQPT